MPTYSNPRLKIRFDYPADWDIQEGENRVTVGSPQPFPADRYKDYIQVMPFQNNLSTDDTLQQDVVDYYEKRKGYSFLSIINDSLGPPQMQKIARKYDFTYFNREFGTLRATIYVAKEGVQGIDIAYFAQENYYPTYLPVLNSLKSTFAFI